MEPDSEHDGDMTGDAHRMWSELAAGYALSSLDEADVAIYLEHAADCPECERLAADLADVVAELAFATPAVEVPASLKASIMRAVVEDDESRANAPSSLAQRRRRNAGASRFLRPVWAAAAAIVLIAAVGTGIAVRSGSHSTSVADQCAKVKCPTISLTASGRNVATVMVLNGTAWVAATGLPSTPSNWNYVLWRIEGGTPVAVAAFTSTPNEGPVKVGPVKVPVSDVDSLAISQEKGTAPLPPTPSDVLAQGVLSS